MQGAPISDAEAPDVGSSLRPDQFGVRQCTLEVAAVELNDLQIESSFWVKTSSASRAFRNSVLVRCNTFMLSRHCPSSSLILDVRVTVFASSSGRMWKSSARQKRCMASIEPASR